MSLLLDTFTGADGTLDGHLPDTPYGSTTWTTSSAPSSGGVLIASNRAAADGYYGALTPSDQSTAGYSFGGVAASGLTIPFTFRTGPDETGDGFRMGLKIYAQLNGVNFYAYIQGTYSGTTMGWQLKCGSSGTPSSVTLADNTSYSGTFSIADGAQSLVLNSVTVSNTETYADTSGLGSFEITIGGYHMLDTLEIVNLTASSDGAVTLPSAIVTATGYRVTGSAALSISPTLSARGGGNARSVMGSPIVFATGQDRTGENALAYTLSMPTLSARGGANGAVGMPSARLGITGTFWGLGRADLSMPEGFVSATGRVATGGSGAITMPLSTLVGYAGAICSITTDEGYTVAATGTAGAVGQATITLPLFDLAATGSRPNSGGAALVMPTARLGATAQAWLIAPSMQLTAVGTAVVAVTYEAYAVNLHKSADRAANEKTPANEVTRYTNYPFDRIVRYKNSYFGMNATGLYLLEGTTDNGTPISYEVRTHVTDFKETALKTVISAYFGGRLGAAETVTLYGGESSTNAYSYTTPRGTHPQNYRQKFGKGIKERYYALGVAGSNEFELSSIDLEINTLARRI